MLKKKIDNNQSETPNLDTSAFDFDDSDTITTQKTVKSGSGVDVSVHIVQEITGGNAQQVQTNVAVSTTVKTHFGGAPSEAKGNASASTSVETNTSTKIECKQEPNDELPCVDSSNSDISNSGSGILDQEELEEILKTIERDESKLSEEIFNELEEFDRIYRLKISQEDSNDSSMYGSMTGSSPGLHKQPPFETGSAGNSANMFESPPANPVRTPPVPFRPPGAITTMTETGPAAETLKQMAAQHQSNQHHPAAFGSKQFSSHDPSYNNYSQNVDPSTYTHQQSYNNQQNVRNGSVYHEGSPDMFSGTKPLTHYPGANTNNTPSSLQQLQNQVQSFTQSPQMEITQSQHMQVNDGARRLHMSQTQHMNMRQPPQNISMSQHQSFSMPNNMAQRQSPGYMNEQMKMQQMYQEKMRQDQRHQSMQAAQMQHFMRPPPEYKMQQPAPEGYPNNGGRQNPLQTMQDMVEQTNNIQTPGYGGIKTEVMPNGMMQQQSAQMAAVMQRSNSTSASGPAMGPNDPSQAGYHMAHMQRQQSYPGSQMESALAARQGRQNGHNYTSAIMRNQRPPNVNVGPDGLNISQPRSQEWPRHMMPQHTGVPRQPSQSMMCANNYSGTTVANGMAGNQPRPMQMSAIQSQAAMMQNSAQAQHMMMQQQGMQMSQRMAMANQSNANYNQRPQQDDFMNILDSASQGSNSDFIDNMAAQSSGVSSDAAWLDEILSGNRDM